MSDEEVLVPHIVILDYETEGLEPHDSAILECHMMHVDHATLQIVSETSMVLTERFKTTLHPVVQDMHTVSGLFDAMAQMRANGAIVAASDLDLFQLKFMQSVSPEPRKIMLCGNSIGQFDVDFMKRYTPKSLRHCHHRVIDVSSYLELHRLYVTQLPPPARAHRSRADCLMSLELLKLAQATMTIAREHGADKLTPQVYGPLP